MPKPRNKKKFIDKKNERTTTFALVHRSQKDPLAADVDAPQFVLHQLPEVDKRKEEEREHGIFYDDDYDYLQHLKNRQEAEYDWDEVDRFLIGKPPAPATSTSKPPKNNLNLPSQVFASETEEQIGLLNRAAPRSGPLLDWDPDIVETLDDDFKGHDLVFHLNDADEDGDIEDDLDILLAEAKEDGVIEDDDDGDYETEEEEDADGEEDYGSEADDDVPSLDGGFSFNGEETKSRFTSYSMSSSVIRRNNQLALLDDKFEEFFDTYDDENVGGLDCEEIEGSRPENSDVMKQILKEFEKEKRLERQKIESTADVQINDGSDGDGDAKEVIVVDDEAAREDRFDCESIISTYSNLYNHPKMISEPRRKLSPIRVNTRTGIPKDVLGKGLTAGALKKLDRETRPESDESEEDDSRTLASRVSALSIRNRHETLEEKKSRKNAVKELKRERRIEKKANKLAFKEEKTRQEKLTAHNPATGMKLL